MHQACVRMLLAAPMHVSCLHIHSFNPYMAKHLATRRWNELGASSSASHVYIRVLKNTESGRAP